MKKLNFDLETGGHYLFNVAPGWTIGGTVSKVGPGSVTITGAAYMESVNVKHSCFDVCFAGSVEEQLKCVKQFYLIPDGHQINGDAILQVTPSKLGFLGLIK